MILIERTKDLSGRKLTKLQAEALAKVCATNGGGLSAFAYPFGVWQGLVNRGLVQGKSGTQSRIVHTTEGYRLNKELQP